MIQARFVVLAIHKKDANLVDLCSLGEGRLGIGNWELGIE